MSVSGITHAVAAEAIVRRTVPLVSFTDFTGRMSAPDGHFESATFGRLPETFATASAILFFRTSVEMGTGRGP
jgi:hypothetical protein